MEKENQVDGKWIPWAGGECPVDDNARVDVEFRDRDVAVGCLANNWNWGHSGRDGDIIAYRLTPEFLEYKPEPAEPVKSEE